MPIANARTFMAACFIGAISLTLLAQAPYATHPRATPSDYAVSQQTPSATFAASVIPRDEIKRLFAVDISSTYVVLEVACYPGVSGSVPLSADDFLVKSGGSEFTHPADAVTVAAVIQQKNTPRLPSGRTTTVVTTATVGYEAPLIRLPAAAFTAHTPMSGQVSRLGHLMPVRPCRRLPAPRPTTA